jgi:methionine synthase I (cobalamin-dependent)
MPADLHPLETLLRQRIVVLDGAMGTMIQRYKLSEDDYRGKRFREWKGKDLKGSLELLLLTKPEIVEEIHTQYLEAGADIIETNTFSATTLGLHDFLFCRRAAGRSQRSGFLPTRSGRRRSSRARLRDEPGGG